MWQFARFPHEISQKNAILPLFFDEMTFFSPFMQFVTAFIPALAVNPSISVTAHLVFVHSVSHPTIAICSFLYKFLIQKEINHIDI